MEINLTKKQAFWLFVWVVFCVFVIWPFVIYPLIYHPDYDVVTNVALLFIGLIGACLVIGWARRMEKKK